MTQTRNKEWVNRIRKDSNDDIKAFFEKTFDVNHNKRQTIIDLLKDKWVDSKLTVDLKANSTEGQKTNTEPQKAKEVPKNTNKKVEENKTKKEDKKQKEESEDDDNDVVDVSDDDDEDEGGKGSSSASKPTPEKPKTNVSIPKSSSSDDNVLRPDILDELKKEFLSIQ